MQSWNKLNIERKSKSKEKVKNSKISQLSLKLAKIFENVSFSRRYKCVTFDRRRRRRRRRGRRRHRRRRRRISFFSPVFVHLTVDPSA